MVRRLQKPGSGFTLIELLVVIAIIGMLVALLLPAVNAARESARRVTCTNQAKQLALANASFETSRGRYPGMAEDYSTPSGVNTAPWLVALMPFMERQDIYDDYTTNYPPTTDLIYIKILRCPSNPPTSVSRGQNSYIGNGGFVSSDKGEDGVLIDRVQAHQASATTPPPSLKTNNVYDGLSNVLFVSENLLAGEWSSMTQTQTFAAPSTPMKIDTVFVWHNVKESGLTIPAGGGNVPGVSAVTPQMKINGDRVNQLTLSGVDLLRPSSQHPGGVVVAFLDGHTQFLRDSVQYHVYQQLMTPSHKKSSAPYKTYVLQDADYE